MPVPGVELAETDPGPVTFVRTDGAVSWLARYRPAKTDDRLSLTGRPGK